MATHSKYKSWVEVFEEDGEYMASLTIEPNPIGSEVDWSKPQKVLSGPICQTPEKAIALFLRGLHVEL